jgi:hypothetical protein
MFIAASPPNIYPLSFRSSGRVRLSQIHEFGCRLKSSAIVSNIQMTIIPHLQFDNRPVLNPQRVIFFTCRTPKELDQLLATNGSKVGVQETFETLQSYPGSMLIRCTSRVDLRDPLCTVPNLEESFGVEIRMQLPLRLITHQYLVLQSTNQYANPFKRQKIATLFTMRLNARSITCCLQTSS